MCPNIQIYFDAVVNCNSCERFQQRFALDPVSLAHIVKCFKDEIKLIACGENAFKSARTSDEDQCTVIRKITYQFTFDGSKGIIHGNVQSSLKDTVCTTEVPNICS